MNREVHVRICGRLGAKFPGPTRQQETELCQTGLRRRGESSAIATGRLPSLRLFSTPLKMADIARFRQTKWRQYQGWPLRRLTAVVSSFSNVSSPMKGGCKIPRG